MTENLSTKVKNLYTCSVGPETPQFIPWSASLMLSYPLLLIVMQPSYPRVFLPGIFRLFIPTFQEFFQRTVKLMLWNLALMRFVMSVDTESRFFEAGYFYFNYKKSTLTMDLIQVPETKYAEDRERKIWQITEQIQSYQPESILLYTGKENTDMLLQQVREVFKNQNLLIWLIKCQRMRRSLTQHYR